MFCKFCGEKIDDTALFCPKCGAKQTNETNSHTDTIDLNADITDHTSSQENFTVPAENGKRSKKIINIIQKCCFCSFIAGIVGLSVFLGIVIIGLIGYGKVFLFDGYDYVKVLSVISIVLMMIGLCGIIAKCILIFILKIEILPTTMIKRILPIVLAVACLSCSVWGFVDCSNVNHKHDSSHDSDYSGGSTTYVITESEAIAYAKNSSAVKSAIAQAYYLKFYYSPDWGTASAKLNSDLTWKVTLKGTIAGYTDDYKTKLVYDKKFTAYVYVTSHGQVSVGSIYRS